MLNYFFTSVHRLIHIGSPLHTDRTSFDLDIASRTCFNLQGIIIIHFVDLAMNAGNSNHLIAFLHVIDKLLLLLCFFCLRADHKKIKHQDHSTHHDQRCTATTFTLGSVIKKILNRFIVGCLLAVISRLIINITLLFFRSLFLLVTVPGKQDLHWKLP